jgi:hypothetical protein
MSGLNESVWDPSFWLIHLCVHWMSAHVCQIGILVMCSLTFKSMRLHDICWSRHWSCLRQRWVVMVAKVTPLGAQCNGLWSTPIQFYKDFVGG